MVLARSYLFAPGDSERLLAKVFAAGADAVVLDLEDAVAPANKEAARERVRRALDERRGEAGPAAWVRINGLRSAHWRADVAAVVGPALAGLRVPKAEAADELDDLDRELSAAEERAGLEPGGVPVACTIESARGLLAARWLAEHPRVSHLCFGEADFVADVGAEPGDPQATLWARSSLVVAARAAGIAPAVAAVYTRLDDEEGLRRTTFEARRLGFFGRSCIHPRQLAVVHRVFTPRPEEVERAREVVAAHEAAAGGGAVAGGEFVDLAVVRRALAILDLAAAGESPPPKSPSNSPFLKGGAPPPAQDRKEPPLEKRGRRR